MVFVFVTMMVIIVVVTPSSDRCSNGGCGVLHPDLTTRRREKHISATSKLQGTELQRCFRGFMTKSLK